MPPKSPSTASVEGDFGGKALQNPVIALSSLLIGL
jgi:hypothetical protein